MSTHSDTYSHILATMTDAQILALSYEGGPDEAAVCERALGGDRTARLLVAEWLAYAAEMAETDA